MQFAFLGKQVLRMSMTFHVFEGFLSLFLCLLIKGIFISEQSDMRNFLLNFSSPGHIHFWIYIFLRCDWTRPNQNKTSLAERNWDQL